ncbi:Terminal uridylyltransferase 7 (TUTase 7) (Zinc finger CCHC domain-containing protein 6) [Durusdinium trenchii]|uniref:Terminal uridylyltransferase 7 (TUTase 7) (Zinc finger CCHC domain-containing protein 6) n=1 Tax=Durusdinium trenchii TaxID=1381693 RepID=A0ABP0J3X4_9DINO
MLNRLVLNIGGLLLQELNEYEMTDKVRQRMSRCIEALEAEGKWTKWQSLFAWAGTGVLALLAALRTALGRRRLDADRSNEFSDLDATCYELKETQDEEEEQKQPAEILSERLAPLLREHPEFTMAQEVLHARVPILKLCFEGELEVDLSCHNTLPLQNTKLLKAYSSLDERIRDLVITVKLWAKANGVCGASQSHLSSYALTLMAIYFMQDPVDESRNLNCVLGEMQEIQAPQALSGDKESMLKIGMLAELGVYNHVYDHLSTHLPTRQERMPAPSAVEVDTCMSTEGALFSLREELKLVSEELAKLSLRVSRLSQNLSALEAVPAAPEWEVVEEGTLPIGVSDISRPYPGAPESPHSPVPEVPRYLLNLCQEKLKATSSTTPKERAERAFAQGHEAWSAIQTGGFYRPASAVPNLPSSHWVILRGLGLQEPDASVVSELRKDGPAKGPSSAEGGCSFGTTAQDQAKGQPSRSGGREDCGRAERPFCSIFRPSARSAVPAEFSPDLTRGPFDGPQCRSLTRPAARRRERQLLFYQRSRPKGKDAIRPGPSPKSVVPTSEDAAASSSLSFLAYLERHGAFKQSRDLGTILWVVGYIVDAAIAQDFDGVKEHLALFVTALGQAALDQSWSTAFLVTLVEEPPATLFSEKGTPLSVARPFSPLMPAAWGAVLLAYLKDLDIMTNKKQETAGKKASGQTTSTDQNNGEASPKRRPRFPKKPKGGEIQISARYPWRQESRANAKIQKALQAYKDLGILGSPEKDVLSDKAKIVGLKSFGINDEELGDQRPGNNLESVKRPLAYRFDFVELFAGRAEVLEDAIRARALADEDWQSVKVHGLENALTNQVALEAEWSVRRCWSLMPVIAKINAIALGAGLYLCLPFCPTKVNPSDDPTRSTELRSAVKGLDLKTMTKEQALALSESAGLRRWAANWIRLTVRLSGISILELGDRSKNRSPCILDFRPSLESFFPMDFDQTLGYPGEGPWPILFPVLLCAVLLLSRPGRSGHPPSWTSVAIWGASLAMAAPLKPRNAGDKLRANIRDLRPPLPSGRPVLKSTEKRREFLFSAFKQWVEERGLLFSELFGNTYQNIEEINTILTAYGRELYRSGRPQNHFSETINSIASWKPQLRRVLQGAWDLAYTWVKLEPSIHHTAMPAQVLLSFLSVCLAWGWVRFGGCIALAWGGLLRPGELLSAKRCHLQLPSDVRFSVPFILLSILEPKSRHTTARRQCAKLDTPDLVQMVELAFSRMQPDEPLWGRSGQTLRARFRSVMEALCLPTTTCKGVKALDLGSLRPGGATHLLQTTESGDLVMRRGRWASYRVMSIYIQEVSATSYLSLLEPDVRDKVLTTAACFPAFLEKAEHLDRAEIPKHVWYFLFTATQ